MNVAVVAEGPGFKRSRCGRNVGGRATPSKAAWLESTTWVIVRLTFHRQRGDIYNAP